MHLWSIVLSWSNLRRDVGFHQSEEDAELNSCWKTSTCSWLRGNPSYDGNLKKKYFHLLFVIRKNCDCFMEAFCNTPMIFFFLRGVCFKSNYLVWFLFSLVVNVSTSKLQCNTVIVCVEKVFHFSQRWLNVNLTKYQRTNNGTMPLAVKAS